MSGNRKIRIAMLGHKRIPSREGGIEVVVQELSRRLVEKGFEVVCYNRRGHHVSGKEFDGEMCREYQGVTLKNVPTVDVRGLAAMSASLTASLALAFGNYDIAHYHGEGPSAMLWLPKLLGKSCIVTIHGLDWQCPKWGWFSRNYIRVGEKMAVKFADEIIVLNSSLKNYFWNTYGRETRLIPNGIKKPKKREVRLIRETYGLEKDGYILYVGRIVKGKGLELLLDAYQRLKTDKKLVIAGGASDSKEFMQDLKSKAADNQDIVFTDFVQGRMLEELYSNAYYFVFPSEREGMSLCILEAMSYGNCCLVSDIPENIEVVGEHAAIFRGKDSRSLQENMQQLCDDPQKLEIWKKEAADYICKKYDWDRITEDTGKLYREFVEKKRG